MSLGNEHRSAAPLRPYRVAGVIIFLASALCKVLLFPAYRSTDFEVHRNWLAITHSLPWQEWYRDTTSLWTLDYPPLFAVFQYILSFPAALIDAGMVTLTNLNYASFATVFYQRATVILVGEAFFMTMLWKYWDTVAFYGALASDLRTNRRQESSDGKHSNKRSKVVGDAVGTELSSDLSNGVGSPRQRLLLCLFCFFQPSLIFIDNVHFQYNALLFGLFTLSVILFASGRPALGAAAYFTLVFMKHLFLYVAPAFAVFFLKQVIFVEEKSKDHLSPQLAGGSRFAAKFNSALFISFVASFVTTTGAVIGPFVFAGNGLLLALLQRLFPFGRGLCHAYWAPNVYPLYNVMDKVLCMAAKQLPKHIVKQTLGVLLPFTIGAVDDPRTALDCSSGNVNTRGLVGLTDGVLTAARTHVVLPTLTPFLTNVAVIVSFLPTAWIALRNGGLPIRGLFEHRNDVRLLLWLCIMSCFSFFMFSWHVHEKAAMTLLLPASLLLGEPVGAATDNRATAQGKMYRQFGFLTIVGTVTCFPLLFTMLEVPIKWALLGVYCCFYAAATGQPQNNSAGPTGKRSTGLFKTGNGVTYNSKEDDVGCSLFDSWTDRVYVGVLLAAAAGVDICQLMSVQRFAFLPLMLLSVIGSVGMIMCCWRYFRLPVHVS